MRIFDIWYKYVSRNIKKNANIWQVYIHPHTIYVDRTHFFFYFRVRRLRFPTLIFPTRISIFVMVIHIYSWYTYIRSWYTYIRIRMLIHIWVYTYIDECIHTFLWWYTYIRYSDTHIFVMVIHIYQCITRISIFVMVIHIYSLWWHTYINVCIHSFFKMYVYVESV